MSFNDLPVLAELRETLATCWHYPTLVALEAKLLGGNPVDRLTSDERMLLGDIRDRRNEWGLAAEAYAAVLSAEPADRVAAYRLVTTAIDAGEESLALRVFKSNLFKPHLRLTLRTYRNTIIT